MSAPHLNVSDDVMVELAVELVGDVLGHRDVTKQVLSPDGKGGRESRSGIHVHVSEESKKTITFLNSLHSLMPSP